jgi:hypothetical protein
MRNQLLPIPHGIRTGRHFVQSVVAPDGGIRVFVFDIGTGSGSTMSLLFLLLLCFFFSFLLYLSVLTISFTLSLFVSAYRSWDDPQFSYVSRHDRNQSRGKILWFLLFLKDMMRALRGIRDHRHVDIS